MKTTYHGYTGEQLLNAYLMVCGEDGPHAPIKTKVANPGPKNIKCAIRAIELYNGNTPSVVITGKFVKFKAAPLS